MNTTTFLRLSLKLHICEQLKLIGHLKLSCFQGKHQRLKINHTFSFDWPNLNKPLASFLFPSQS